VHTHLWVADVYGAAAAALAGVPGVSTEHNVAEAEARWRVRARILAARGQVRVTAVSGAVARSWSEAGLPQRKIEVIPNGIDLARYQKPWQGLGSRRVLAIGRPVPQKGFDVLQSAVRGWSDVAVEIAGHAGPVHDIPDRLSVAAVLVVPSRWEGFGLVAAEGLAAGVPVVASDLPALREVIGEAGLLVPPGDEVGLRDAIRRVVDDPALSRRLSEAGRDRARSFSVDRMRDGYEALYERVLAEHGSPLSP
jgi:glycosyltransferase involved in cell wall biosynthesis